MSWRPTAPPAALALRARLLETTRAFFRERGVLEVTTPVAVRHGVTDPQLASFALAGDGPRYLQTSPEYAMKRLLAAGSGDIFQVCQVFRDDERSRLHNPEFTLVEWYRVGFDLPQIMEETAGLVARLLTTAGAAPRTLQPLSYREAFAPLGIDPLTVEETRLRKLARDRGLAAPATQALDRDGLLDFLIAVVIGPTLGRNALCALHHYPASQAALARHDPQQPGTALRFELYADGIELANGYVELADAAEQQRRFESDRQVRARLGRADMQPDASLLAALAAGLPDCAGVALGFDRVLMLAAGAGSIDEVIAFTWENA
ncbi:MAG: EF-P lysine aminoacylase EpmA [Steroidobacteraceae bacterium]